MRLARTAAAAAAAVAALFLPAVAQPAAAAPVTARTASVAVPGETLTLPVRDALARLSIAQEDRTGYSRDAFRHWVDADHDGCHTRAEVLQEEAVVAPVQGARCALSGGRCVHATPSPVTTLCVLATAPLRHRCQRHLAAAPDNASLTDRTRSATRLSPTSAAPQTECG